MLAGVYRDDHLTAERYRATLEEAGGSRRIPLPALELRRGSWGGAIPASLYDVSALRLLGRRPGKVLEASVAPSGAS